MTSSSKLTPKQLTKRLKNNHKMLKNTDLSAFKLIEAQKDSHRNLCASAESMSLYSTNSSDSGPLTSWENSWTITNKHSHCVHLSTRINTLNQNSSSTTRKARSKSPSVSNTHPKPRSHSPMSRNGNTNEYVETCRVQHISDVCFLRSGFGLLVAEPYENRIQIFSIKRHTILASLSIKNTADRLSESISFACDRKPFIPCSLTETYHEDVVAVASDNNILYIRMNGDSEIEAHVSLKDRSTLKGIECLNPNRILVSETSPKIFLGTYDMSGQLVRKFRNIKETISDPTYLSWSHNHQIVAVVDSYLERIVFLDQEGKLLNIYGDKRSFSGSMRLSSMERSTLSKPTGAAWCNPNHLMVVDNLNNNLTTLDFRNLSREVFTLRGSALSNPRLVACNQRGNRLLLTEENKIIKEHSSLGMHLLRVNSQRDVSATCDNEERYGLKMFHRHGVSRENLGNSIGLFED